MTIGEKIKEIRLSKGMTLEEVGNLSGLSRQMVSEIERSPTFIPGLPVLMRFADAMGCSVLDIICEPLGIEDKPCANSKSCPFFKRGE